jgi:hypothetical protein
MLHPVPIRLQAVTKSILLFHIPVILIANIIGSFIGISYRESSVLTLDPTCIHSNHDGPVNLSNNDSEPIFMKGFTDNTAQLLWTVFSRLALAFLTSYQFVGFALLMLRTVNGLSGPKSSVETGHNGLARNLASIYIAIGLALGVIENIAGFYEGSFEAVFFRRMLRALGRAFLVLSIIRGFVAFHHISSCEQGSISTTLSICQ